MASDHSGTQVVDGGAVKTADAPTELAPAIRARKRKWPRRIFAGTVVVGLSGWLLGVILLRSWTATPPASPANGAILQLNTQEHDGKVWLGESWIARREGLLTVYLKGAPFELGYANGVLLQPQIHTLENEFIKMIHGYVPNEWA